VKLGVATFRRTIVAPMALAAAAVLAIGIAAQPPARAADADQVKRGSALVKTWCASCHVTGAGAQRSAADIAPPFAALANDKSISDARIRGVLARPHGRMPTDALTASQINDVAAYIISLRLKPR